MGDGKQERTFEQVKDRLDQIVDEVKAEDISLDEALALYEEAVKLGLEALDLSEIEVLAASETSEEESSEEPSSGGETPEAQASSEEPSQADAEGITEESGDVNG